MKFVILSFPVDYEVHGDRCVCLCFLPGFSIVTSVYWLLSIWAESKQPNIFHLCIVIAVIKSKVNIGLLKPQLYVHRSNAIVSTYVIKQGYVSVEYFYSLLTPFIMGSYVWHRSLAVILKDCILDICLICFGNVNNSFRGSLLIVSLNILS